MSRSRRKLDTSPIDYDDVVDSPALKGMVSFLEIPPGELPRLDFTSAPEELPGATEAGTPFSGPPVTSVPEPPSPVSAGTTESGTPQKGIPTAQPPTAEPPLYYPPVLSRPTARIRRAASAQDGHSFGEQALYDALWQHGHPYAGDCRIITLGYRRMADLARLTVNNCKANIQSLIQKLAVEEVAGFTHSHGRTYLVHNPAAVLQRRRAAGLTHYIKSRGVVFVDPDTGEALTARIRDRSGIPFSGAPSSGTPERIGP